MVLYPSGLRGESAKLLFIGSNPISTSILIFVTYITFCYISYIYYHISYIYFTYNFFTIMAPKIGEDTKITLDLKTIGTIAVMIATVVGMWYAVQADIQEAKELPKPDVTRTEYDLKDKLIRETIINTQNKVDENGKKLDKIEERLYEISKK